MASKINLNKKLFSVRDLSKNYDGLKVLENIHFDVCEGEIISILGPSGCGKTTLLKIIGNLLEGSSNFKALSNIFGFVFQTPALLPWKTAEQHLNFCKKFNRGNNFLSNNRILDLIGLKGFKDYYSCQISGGMQQRLAIGMALSHNPEVLLMDEPFSSLDEITRQKLQEELLRIFSHKDNTSKAILYVTHSIEEAVFLSNKIIILGNKPAKIKKVINIEFNKPRNNLLRSSKEFFDYLAQVRRLVE
jgi:NitT/TauT family transport system ATP-binding protein